MKETFVRNSFKVINNAQIGCYLNWHRHPKNYLTTKKLYESLIFLHI
jgi:hypothetical protein